MKEKLKAKLKEAGLPEYLAAILKVNKEEEVDKVVTAFAGITDTSSPEFEEALNKLVQAQEESTADKRVSEAVKTHEKTLKGKYEFVEKAKKKEETQAQTGNSEIDDLKKTVEKLQNSVSEFVTQQSKTTLNSLFTTRATSEKKIPLEWAKKYSVEDADKLDEMLDTAEKEYTAFKQSILVEHYGGTPPEKGNTTDLTENSAVEFAKIRNNTGQSDSAVPGKKL